MSIDHISCQRLSDGRWQVNLRGEGRGWTCAQQTFERPIPALLHTLAQYAGDDAAALLRELTQPKIDTEDLF